MIFVVGSVPGLVRRQLVWMSFLQFFVSEVVQILIRDAPLVRFDY